MMDQTWRYPYHDQAERDWMEESVRRLSAAGRNVALGVRHPPGVLVVHGDKDGIKLAQGSRPIKGHAPID